MAPLPQLDQPAINFALPDGDKRVVNLKDFRGKNVVLAFFPADWSPTCTSELALIQETLADIRAYNAEVIAVSVDNVWSHKAWVQQKKFEFPLLSDFWPHGEVSSQYGVFLDEAGTANRALFFIDAEGVVRDRWVAESPGMAPARSVIIGALEKMKAGSHAR